MLPREEPFSIRDPHHCRGITAVPASKRMVKQSTCSRGSIKDQGQKRCSQQLTELVHSRRLVNGRQ